MEQVYQGFYDLHSQQDNENLTASVKEYTNDGSGGYTLTTSVVTKEKEHTHKVAYALSNKIKEYGEDYLIVLVSNVAWELYFNEDLAETLLRYGSF